MKRAARPANLRRRLFALIIVPLVLVAVAASALRYQQAQEMSRRLYDDTLKVVAHAVAREVVLTQGDLVADALLESLVGALGDPIFYQVSAAEGRYFTGYTDAPVDPRAHDLPGGKPVFFDAYYLGAPVRVVVLREFISDPDFDGWTTVQVWQTLNGRRALSMTLLRQAGIVLAMVLAVAAVLVWFAVGRGLRPLTDLREAVALRSPDELGPIRRQVPQEVAPLVATMNQLFARLRAELDRRNAFIANAAHQLRNPVAAIRAQAETALAARTAGDRLDRLRDINDAARHLSRLAQQLLNYDRAIQSPVRAQFASVDLSSLVAEVARRHVPRALGAGVEIDFGAPDAPVIISGNAVLLEEAVDNLIDNALNYGATDGGRIAVRLWQSPDGIVLQVRDDGPGIPPSASESVFERFVRLSDNSLGCGLGLPIVRAIAEAHGGSAAILSDSPGCAVEIRLPAGVVRHVPSGQRPVPEPVAA